MDEISAYFRILARAGIAEAPPSLMMNLDETGFEQRKSGRAKTNKVAVPKDY